MIPYQLDPSLHPAEPAPPQLDDGCSPPAAAQEQQAARPVDAARQPVDPALWAKSDF